MGSAENRAWVLLVMGIVSAFGALFGPPEPWGGVDIGATSATLFVLTVGAAIWLFAARGDAVFPDHMSVSERRTWIALIFLGVILTAFIKEMWVLSLHGEVPTDLRDLFARRFIERYVLAVIAWSLISHLIGKRAGGIEADERDLRLRHEADRAGSVALTLIVIAGISVLVSVPRTLLTWWLEPIVLANVLVGMMIAKSLVEHLMLACFYRIPHGRT